MTWLPVTRDNLYYLNLSNELSLGTNPDKEKMAFWDTLYSKHFKIWEHPKVNNEEAPRKEPEVLTVVSEVETVVTEPDAVVAEADAVVAEAETVVTEVDTVVAEVETMVTEAEPVVPEPEPEVSIPEPVAPESPPIITQENVVETAEAKEKVAEEEVIHINGNGIERKPRPSNEIKMVQQTNGVPKDVIRANDPPEDDLPKNIGVNKFVNFFESLGGKK